MNHHTVPSFWKCYDALPKNTQKLADKNSELLKKILNIHLYTLKKIDKYWSARVGIYYRTLAVEVDEGMLWFWIGNHSDYDKLIG